MRVLWGIGGVYCPEKGHKWDSSSGEETGDAGSDSEGSGSVYKEYSDAKIARIRKLSD